MLDPLSGNADKGLLVCQARRLARSGKDDAVIRRYEEVLKIDPKHREALEELAPKAVAKTKR